MYSFFTTFRATSPVLPGSAITRGVQMAEYLGGRLNPEKGYEDDVCIWVKEAPKPKIVEIPKCSYLDIIDSPRAESWLLTHPQMWAIALGKTQYEFFSKVLNKDRVILLPHHNCNYERIKRIDREIRTVGLIGTSDAFYYDIPDLTKRFAELGLDFKYLQVFGKRTDVVDFYKTIDIQVLWRRPKKDRLCNPLKLTNAGSFGIPTVSYPEKSYTDEWDGYFIPALTIEELITETCRLRDEKNYYDDMSHKVDIKAEEYHIEKISKLYENLRR